MNRVELFNITLKIITVCISKSIRLLGAFDAPSGKQGAGFLCWCFYVDFFFQGTVFKVNVLWKKIANRATALVNLCILAIFSYSQKSEGQILHFHHCARKSGRVAIFVNGCVFFPGIVIYPVILRILGFFRSSFSRKIHHPWLSPNITG